MLAQTEFAGDVSGVWHPDGNPFIQIGEANIPAGERLTIQPDVEVFIGEEMTLTANGLIIAIGSEEDTIRFLGSPGVISGRILLQAERDTSQFQYCRFDSLDYGIWFEENRVVVEHSLLLSFSEWSRCYRFFFSFLECFRVLSSSLERSRVILVFWPVQCL